MYDYVFVTHLPAFYKVNLYNEIAKTKKILVLFVGMTSVQRTDDFVSADCRFEFSYLSSGDFEARNHFKTALKLLRKLSSISYRKIVVGGWDLPEFWLSVLWSGPQKSALALESTPNESAVKNLRGMIKRFFLKRISLVFASGTIHRHLMELLGYKGEVRITGGVGIINRSPRAIKGKAYEKKFLYLGRFSSEKSPDFLIQVFSKLPKFHLEMIGDGPLREALSSVVPANVLIRPHVKNSQIASVFERNDFLILPSKREPWGLVIEEALYYGRPVIVSSACGGAGLVNEKNGYVFQSESELELLQILKSITPVIYESLLINVAKSGIELKDQNQINAYTYDGEVR